MLKLHLDLNITFSLQYDKSLSIVCLGLILKSSLSVPKVTELGCVLNVMLKRKENVVLKMLL